MAHTLHSRFWKVGSDGVAVLTDPENGSITINTRKDGDIVEAFDAPTKLTVGHYTVETNDDLYVNGEIYEIERIWNFVGDDTQSSKGRFSHIEEIREIAGVSVSSRTTNIIRATARVT